MGISIARPENAFQICRGRISSQNGNKKYVIFQMLSVLIMLCDVRPSLVYSTVSWRRSWETWTGPAPSSSWRSLSRDSTCPRCCGRRTSTLRWRRRSLIRHDGSTGVCCSAHSTSRWAEGVVWRCCGVRRRLSWLGGLKVGSGAAWVGWHQGRLTGSSEGGVVSGIDIIIIFILYSAKSKIIVLSALHCN